MTKPKPALVGIALALMVALSSAPPAAAQDILLTQAKRADGPYRDQAFAATVKDSVRSFYFKVANNTADELEVALDDVSFGSGLANFGIRWFRGRKEVTDAARDATFQFDLAVGAKRVFRGRVKPRVRHPGALCLAPRFVVEPDIYTTIGAIYINSNFVCD